MKRNAYFGDKTSIQRLVFVIHLNENVGLNLTLPVFLSRFSKFLVFLYFQRNIYHGVESFRAVKTTFFLLIYFFAVSSHKLWVSLFSRLDDTPI